MSHCMATLVLGTEPFNLWHEELMGREGRVRRSGEPSPPRPCGPRGASTRARAPRAQSIPAIADHRCPVPRVRLPPLPAEATRSLNGSGSALPGLRSTALMPPGRCGRRRLTTGPPGRTAPPPKFRHRGADLSADPRDGPSQDGVADSPLASDMAVHRGARTAGGRSDVIDVQSVQTVGGYRIGGSRTDPFDGDLAAIATRQPVHALRLYCDSASR